MKVNSNQFIAYTESLTEYPRDDIARIFNQMDSDADGLVSPAEMKAAILAGDFALPPEPKTTMSEEDARIVKLVKDIDEGSLDGKFTADQFIRYCEAAAGAALTP